MVMGTSVWLSMEMMMGQFWMLLLRARKRCLLSWGDEGKGDERDGEKEENKRDGGRERKVGGRNMETGMNLHERSC